jgi:hypothetical protein
MRDSIEPSPAVQEKPEYEKVVNEMNQSIKFKERQQTIKEQVEQEEELEATEA